MLSKTVAPLINPQCAYHLRRCHETDDIDDDILNAMRAYLMKDLGIAADTAQQRAGAELSRETPKFILRSLAAKGIAVKGRRVLDLGAGLGGMSEELALNGAQVAAVEPGGGWATLAERRVRRHGGQFQLLSAFGESIPLGDESVDLIISLQVLEHVRDPNQVLAEAWRVLRPGGYFLLACENYLAFWEPHYRIPWFPMLPKAIGKLYLRILGRSPDFLEQAITYTTFPSVIGECRRLGFVRQRDVELANYLAAKNNATWRLMRLISLASGGRGPRLLDDARNYFKIGINELLEKPLTKRTTA